MTNWTPGPWSVIGDGTDILALENTPDSIVIATTRFVTGTPTERELADARLIASSPEMYALLVDLYADIVANENGEYVDWSDRLVRIANLRCRIARGEP